MHVDLTVDKYVNITDKQTDKLYIQLLKNV